MSTVFSPDEYNSRHLPGGFTKAMRDVIQYAADHGWNIEIKGLIVRLHAPDKSKALLLSASNHNPPLQSYRRSIKRLGAAPTKKPQPDLVVEPVLPDPVVLVREGPMLSKGGSAGDRYTSDVATQREWSNGDITYHCTRCDFEGLAPRSMASHWHKHVNEDRRNAGNHKGIVVKASEPSQKYTPSEERLASLSEALAAELLTGTIDWTDAAEAGKALAYVALAWENARHRRSEPGLSEPLSDSDLLNKIRSLVDNGLYESQQRRIAELEASVTAAIERADRAEDTLSAFADLAKGLSA